MILFGFFSVISFILFFTKEKHWNQSLRLEFKNYGERMVESSGEQSKMLYVHFFLYSSIAVLFYVFFCSFFIDTEHEYLQPTLQFYVVVLLVGVLGFKTKEEIIDLLKTSYKPVLITLIVLLIVFNSVAYFIKCSEEIVLLFNYKISLLFIGVPSALFCLFVLIPTTLVHAFIRSIKKLLRYCLSKDESLTYFLVSIGLLGFIIRAVIGLIKMLTIA